MNVKEAAELAFEQYANQFDLDGDRWQDMPLNEIFAAGYKAGLEKPQAMELCGCGRPVRYLSFDGSGNSCSKHPRCQSYDELKSRLQEVVSVSRQAFYDLIFHADTAKTFGHHGTENECRRIADLLVKSTRTKEPL